MGILVSQLPQAELARLKAELAETLISYFCYPRFYDYRTDSLRMRPVDRAKRQEVWQYLGSVDLNTWGRIDLMSPDFQRQVERLLIYFVQRNRTFFGEQGRKRMADIRILINTSSTSIVEGLREHLTGHTNAFGNPRPVTSWVTSNVTRHLEPTWEQLAASTMLLQQQLQELRGEIKTAMSEVQPNGVAAKHSKRDRSTANGNSATKPEVITSNKKTSTGKSAEQAGTQTPIYDVRTTIINPPATSTSLDAPIAPPSTPTAPSEQINIAEEKGIPDQSTEEQVSALHNTTAPPQKQTSEPVKASIQAPAIAQPRELARAEPLPHMEVTTKEQENTTVLVSEEDVVIFQQMRHQLVVWSRVEAVRAGIDIAGHEPSELLELLQHVDSFDETQLQVTSTLLTLCDQIIAAGHASLIEYKQAIMFYLMHTRSSR